MSYFYLFKLSYLSDYFLINHANPMLLFNVPLFFLMLGYCGLSISLLSTVDQTTSVLLQKVDVNWMQSFKLFLVKAKYLLSIKISKNHVFKSLDFVFACSCQIIFNWNSQSGYILNIILITTSTFSIPYFTSSSSNIVIILVLFSNL